MRNPLFEKIEFAATDGLLITADLYLAENPKGFMVLCHRSHCNRAEYRETAPQFNGLGYSCLAIDQRSGMKVFGEVNETKQRAKAKGLATGYRDAWPDVEAAVLHGHRLNNGEPIILVGSSYSAALALLLAAQMEEVGAVVCFSPGEYLKGISVAQQIAGLAKPVFVSSAKKEIEQTAELVAEVEPRFIHHFKPEVDGFHGSKTLWKSVPGHETYWRAVKDFLRRVILPMSR
ncbi:MAG: alpha/beta hydrolase [Desulfofustis sp. PB-SRB1]|jgi:alpha-beta hydrolase superfamily lysophospholipase|nr:alpha/beta hydrolase [Desulfofustis sp. PB-SRB1]MBM1003632.1 alpha/beta hydrolase [Desulfofustis sp. PB-SRB1]HBH27395.1 alpha/beta hydrolase [Desulfofustis sp.]HBH30566.1 alpha/beta hydrolase [Desulfofustis sp.]